MDKKLNHPSVLQKHKQHRRLKSHYGHVEASHKNESLQMDIADLKKYSRTNKNFSYLLMILDIFSRKLWVTPLKNKEMNSWLPVIESHFRDNEPPKHITSDQEFNKQRFIELCHKHKVRPYFGEPYQKWRTGNIERAIGSFKHLMAKFFTAFNTTTYIDKLQELVENYNNTMHRSIGTTPNWAWKHNDRFLPEKKPMESQNPKVQLRFGDYVRILQEDKGNAFRKGHKLWSNEIYVVVDKTGQRYKLKHYDTDKPVSQTYASHQLQVIDKIPDDYKKQKQKSPPPKPTFKNEKQNEIERENKIQRRVEREGITYEQDTTRKLPPRVAKEKAKENIAQNFEKRRRVVRRPPPKPKQDTPPPKPATPPPQVIRKRKVRRFRSGNVLQNR